MYEHASVKKCACLVSNLNDVIITRSRERFLWRVAEASLAETLPSCVAHAPRPWVASGPTQFVQRCGLVAHVDAREVVIGRQGRACAAPQPLPGQRSYCNLKTEIKSCLFCVPKNLKRTQRRSNVLWHQYEAGALGADVKTYITPPHSRHGFTTARNAMLIVNKLCLSATFCHLIITRGVLVLRL